MDEENVVVDERIEELREIAKTLVLHYVGEKYKDKEGIGDELNRIDEAINAIKIVPENLVPGSPTRASNDKDGKVTLRFKDKTNITDKEIDDFLETLVHEFYHSVCKTEKGMGAVFLEEGYVTYITAESIRYAMENPPEIKGVTSEELQQKLVAQDLKNGYEYASEFVRSTQLIMELYGKDSMYEYMFNRNSVESLALVAGEISPEFEKMIRRQVNKTPSNSENLESELIFFEFFFDKLDYSNLDKTNLEMNEVLQRYLVEHGITSQDTRLRNLVNEFTPHLIAYNEISEELKGLAPEEREKRIRETLPSQEFSWDLKTNFLDIREQAFDLRDFYDKSDSKIKSRTFGSLNFFSLAFCYDMALKGIKNPTDEQIMQYISTVSYDDNLDTQTKSVIKFYFDKVAMQVENGASIVDVINDNLADNMQFMFQVDSLKNQTNRENYWENVRRIAELSREQNVDNHNDFYGRVYNTLLEMTQKYFEDNKVYTLEDLNVFRQQMQDMYDVAAMPEYIKEIGFTPDKIFLKTVTNKAREGTEQFDNQMMSLLEIIKNGNMNLGISTKDLEDFCVKASSAYEEVEQSGSEEEKIKFQELFLHDFAYTDNLRATNIRFRKSSFRFENENRYLVGIQEKIFSSLDFYTRMVKDENGQPVMNIEELFRENPTMFTNLLRRSQGFLEVLSSQMPAGFKAHESFGKLFFDDMKSELIGNKYPTLTDVYSFDYSSCGELVPIILKQAEKEIIMDDISKMRDFFLVEGVERAVKSIAEISTFGETEFAALQIKSLSDKIAEILDKNESARKPLESKLQTLGEKNESVARVIRLLNSQEVDDFSQESQEQPVLTSKTMQQMAANPDVQRLIPSAEVVLESLERPADIKRSETEH